VLAVLADAEWAQLDLAGCSQLNGVQLLALAHLMPNMRMSGGTLNTWRSGDDGRPVTERLQVRF
jgi:hypothetical protein